MALERGIVKIIENHMFFYDLGLLGIVQTRLGGLLGRLGGLLGRVGGLWPRLGASSGLCCSILEASSAASRPVGPHLRPSSRRLRPSWGRLEAILGSVEAMLDTPGAFIAL